MCVYLMRLCCMFWFLQMPIRHLLILVGRCARISSNQHIESHRGLWTPKEHSGLIWFAKLLRFNFPNKFLLFLERFFSIQGNLFVQRHRLNFNLKLESEKSFFFPFECFDLLWNNLYYSQFIRRDYCWLRFQMPFIRALALSMVSVLPPSCTWRDSLFKWESINQMRA